MPAHERLESSIARIDLSFVERRRTPEWTIQLGFRCLLAEISLLNASKYLEKSGVNRSQVAIHEYVHKAELQPISTATEDQIAVDEEMVGVTGDEYWLYSAVDPETNDITHFRLFPWTTKQTTRWFLAELHRHCRLDGVVFLVDDASYLGTVLDEAGCRFRVMSSGNRNVIERIFCVIDQLTL